MRLSCFLLLFVTFTECLHQYIPFGFKFYCEFKNEVLTDEIVDVLVVYVKPSKFCRRLLRHLCTSLHNFFIGALTCFEVYIYLHSKVTSNFSRLYNKILSFLINSNFNPIQGVRFFLSPIICVTCTTTDLCFKFTISCFFCVNHLCHHTTVVSIIPHLQHEVVTLLVSILASSPSHLHWLAIVPV